MLLQLAPRSLSLPFSPLSHSPGDHEHSGKERLPEAPPLARGAPAGGTGRLQLGICHTSVLRSVPSEKLHTCDQVGAGTESSDPSTKPQHRCGLLQQGALRGVSLCPRPYLLRLLLWCHFAMLPPVYLLGTGQGGLIWGTATETSNLRLGEAPHKPTLSSLVSKSKSQNPSLPPVFVCVCTDTHMQHM